MWVSKERWNAVEERIKELERWQKWHGHLYARYPENDDYPIRSAPIPLYEVVKRILNHLGLKLVYVPGREEGVDVVVKKDETP